MDLSLILASVKGISVPVNPDAKTSQAEMKENYWKMAAPILNRLWLNFQWGTELLKAEFLSGLYLHHQTIKDCFM